MLTTTDNYFDNLAEVAVNIIHAEILRNGLFDMQACVPKTWSDEKVLIFAEAENPCGTTRGWAIRRQGDERLSGYDERVQCHDHEDNCHIMLDA